jgi:hypothetical protein
LTTVATKSLASEKFTSVAGEPALLPYVEKAVWLLDSQVEFIEGRIQNERMLAGCPLCKPEKPSLILNRKKGDRTRSWTCKNGCGYGG